ERMKEELRVGRTLGAAIEAGATLTNLKVKVLSQYLRPGHSR
ncbi:unnamed protein product, partial [marine sediment metagenome]